MHAKRFVLSGLAIVAAGILCAAMAFSANPPPKEVAPVSVEVARDRAKLMHDLYESTLLAMHQHYFHGERAVVPARAMEDVFAEMKQRTKAEARWISVNLKPMSIAHEPKTDFEKLAAKELGEGKSEVEKVEGGYFRRAGAITMGNDCLSCHRGFSQDVSKKPRFAGLIISLPVVSDAKALK